MTLKKVQIDSKGVKRVLKSYKPEQSIAEYIWNGFDAGASIVNISYEHGDIPSGGLKYISISDNGRGIDSRYLSSEFTPFFVSEKHVDDERQKKTLPHGKKGYGRLTFFSFASTAIWQTIYDEDGLNKSYDIEIASKNLIEYKNSVPQDTSNSTGTSVTFQDVKLTVFSMAEIEEYLRKEFAFFLELNKYRDYYISINGERLKYDLLILARDNGDISTEKDIFNWEVIQWRDRNTEASNIYLINSLGDEIYKTTTKLNRKSDSFLHSAYIRSSFFDNFVVYDSENPQPNLEMVNSSRDDVYKYLIETVNVSLKKIRKPYLHSKSNQIIVTFEREGVFPDYKPNHPIEKIRHDELVNVIRELYISEPRLFNDLNIDQKKIFVRFLDTLLASNARDNIFTILDSILNLDDEEIENLSEIIKRSSLENIIDAIKLLEDRLRVLENLKLLVFNKDINANERDHLQKLIQDHYWIFGEQYNLVTAEEPDFEEALKRYRLLVYGEIDIDSLSSEDKNKEMDIFAVRQNKLSSAIEHIVIELKHPNVNIGEKEISQIKRYARTIKSDDRFNASTMEWKFFLIGNGFSSDKYVESEIETNKGNGEDFLIQSVDKIKIYVVRWSEIITGLEIKFDFVMSKLKIKRETLVSESKEPAIIVRENINISSSSPSQPASSRSRRRR